MRERGAQRIQNGLTCRRQAQRDAVQLLAPALGSLRLLALEPGDRIAGCRQRGRSRKRRDERDGATTARRQFQAIPQHGRRETCFVLNGVGGSRRSFRQQLRNIAGIESRHDDPIRRLQCIQPALAVDAQGLSIPEHVVDRRDAARPVEKLRRRIHLEWPDREHQRHGAPMIRMIFERVTGDQLRACTRAGTEGGHAHRQFAIAPRYARNGKITV
ncbi:hypothetical protein D3C83_01060 [compost metagenome]